MPDSTRSAGSDETPQRKRPLRKQRPIRCGGCENTWTGLAVAHCGACHRTFATVRYFDRHRSPEGPHGRCLDPATVTGLEFREGMWRGPATTAAALAAKLAAKRGEPA